MKYLHLCALAILFGSIGWFLRGEGKDEGVDSLQAGFPLAVLEDTREYLEGEWHYEKLDQKLIINGDDFTLSLANGEDLITGKCLKDGLNFINEDKIEFKMVVSELKFPEDMLIKMKEEFTNGDPFGDGEFDDEYFRQTHLTAYLLVQVNTEGETFIEVTQANWADGQKRIRSRILRKKEKLEFFSEVAGEDA